MIDTCKRKHILSGSGIVLAERNCESCLTWTKQYDSTDNLGLSITLRNHLAQHLQKARTLLANRTCAYQA